jgi:hypothetical protein
VSVSLTGLTLVGTPAAAVTDPDPEFQVNRADL